MKRKAVYAGSFDPPHLGHEWMIQRGSEIFDELVILVAKNPEKTESLPLSVRIELLGDIADHLENVFVACLPVHEFTVNYAFEKGYNFLLRGIRGSNDFEYERQLMIVNSEINDRVTTIFLVPPNDLTIISSSLIKGLMKNGTGRSIVAKMVNPKVLGEMYE